MNLYWNTNPNRKGYIYFHFAELEKLPSGQQREFNISLNGEFMETVTLEYLKPATVVSPLVSGPQFYFSMDATQESSQYPPILSALEFLSILEHLNTPTAIDDSNAFFHFP